MNKMTITHELQERWRSPVLWAAIASLLLVVGGSIGLWDKLGITSDAAQTVINGILGVLSTLGILNDPTNSEGA